MDHPLLLLILVPPIPLLTQDFYEYMSEIQLCINAGYSTIFKPTSSLELPSRLQTANVISIFG